MTGPLDAVTASVVALGRALRDAGVAVAADQEITVVRALNEVDVRDERRVYWAARSSFVHRPEDVRLFDALFERFWSGLLLRPEVVTEAAESDPRMPGPQHGGEATPQFRQEGRSSQLLDGEASRATRELPSAPGDNGHGRADEPRRGVLAAYSAEEVLVRCDPFDWQSAELEAVRRLADGLRAAAPQRPSRRLRPGGRGGRLDLRRTVRGALRTDGEPLHPAWSAPSRRPRRLLILCDVSGSMERYSRALLAALGGIVGAGVDAEAFVFATRLTRLTEPLSGHDNAAALERARASVVDWSGGTRIGAALADLNARWGRRGFARGALVLIVSDGWDRGDPVLLQRELERLRLQARRLVWINPRPTALDGQPLAVGMRAALPYVDDFVPGHDPRAVAALARLIGGLGAGRPQRRQRPAGARV